MDVKAGGEGSGAVAAEDDGADVGVLRELFEDGAEGVDHGFCEGVEFGGAVDFDVGYVGGGECEVEILLLGIVGGCHFGRGFGVEFWWGGSSCWVFGRAMWVFWIVDSSCFWSGSL